MSDMKAYRISEYDWYAAHSFEHAIKLAAEHTGEPEAEVVDDMVATGEPEDMNMLLRDDETGEPTVTVAEWLGRMGKPGWCFGIEV